MEFNLDYVSRLRRVLHPITSELGEGKPKASNVPPNMPR